MDPNLSENTINTMVSLAALMAALFAGLAFFQTRKAAEASLKSSKAIQQAAEQERQLLEISRESSIANQHARTIELLFTIDQQLTPFDALNTALSPGGRLTGTTAPMTDDDERLLIRYMGFFERIDIMVENGLLPVEVVRSFYRTRLQRLANHPELIGPILGRDGRSAWAHLYSLCERVDVVLPQSGAPKN